MNMDGQARGTTSTETTGAQATAFIIFGAGGDLSWRMLGPALFDLFLDERLVAPFWVLAVDRATMSDADLQDRLRDGVARFSRHGAPSDSDWQKFASQVSYARADFEDPGAYNDLASRLGNLPSGDRPLARVFYCATPPSMFGPIAEGLASVGLARQSPNSRIVVEKPFGHDLASAKALNRQLAQSFDEEQIFRIDHFLGKETVQNVLAFRFANPIFEPIWDRRYVDYVAVSVAETLGVEHRGEYYDNAGCLRDMVQNHLMQLLCIMAMEPPVAFCADDVRQKKVDVLRAVRPVTSAEVRQVAVRGQYSAGRVAGQQVVGYREEPGVSPTSSTETFAALKLFVDNWRWHGVPFYLRTGKRLPEAYSEIVMAFKPVPHQAFPAEAVSDWNQTLLAIGMQPYQGALMRIQAKRPGARMHLSPVDLHFTYRQAFEIPTAEPYETLLFDVMAGDAMLFMRADQVEAAWKIVDPVLDAWASVAPDESFAYQAGTWGPLTAEDLVARDGHTWPAPALLAALGPGECDVPAPAAREG
jgi:glucose-6-phosphate 1-dehydrogenase